MKLLLYLFTLFMAVSLKAQNGTYFPSNLFLLNLPTNAAPAAFLAVNAAGQVFETATPAGGSGTPGGSTYSVQWNTNSTFAGDSFLQYFPASAAGGDGFARFLLSDGSQTNMMRDTGFGTVSGHNLYLYASNTLRLALTPAGHFGPAGFSAYSNAFSLGFANFPWSTSFVNQVSAKVGIDVGVGSGTAAIVTLSDANGTNYQLTTPAMSSNVFERGPKNMSPGVRVYFNETGTNQATNINIGEYMESAVTNITHYGSGVSTNVTSIVLTPGEWDVTGLLTFDRNGANFVNVGLYMAVSPTTNNSFAGEQSGYNASYNYGAASNTFSFINLSVPAVRVVTATNATYYLKGYADIYNTGFPTMSGRISARRWR